MAILFISVLPTVIAFCVIKFVIDENTHDFVAKLIIGSFLLIYWILLSVLCQKFIES